MRAYGRNGEKLDTRYTTMPNGELRIQMVGKRSGIVYEDSYARKMNILASGNLNSGNVKTGVLEHGKQKKWQQTFDTSKSIPFF